jgi:hypothetical protein
MLQAYVIQWIIPEYEMSTVTAVAMADVSRGGVYLGILGVVLVVISVMVVWMNRKKKAVSF